MKYRKKPVIIDAVQWNPDKPLGDYPEWLAQEIQSTAIPVLMGLRIFTLEGGMTANPGDWIIRGIKGELYPCKDEIFRSTYEPVEES